MLVILVLQAVLVIGPVPLAHATPPDPRWIPGIYDAADQDDVVGMLVDDGLALASATCTGAQPVATSPRSLNPLAESLGIVAAVSTLRLRSLPLR